MNCKYMNMLRVVRGNAFKLKIAVEAYTPSGRRIDSFALGEAVLKLDKNGTLTTKEYTILEGTTILVAFDGSESLGVYGFQMSGEYEGEAWRWANAEIFQIVESNVKAHIPEGCVLLDDTYNMALKIVLSGGDGITFTPSVSEQGIISWTNDGGLPNPEPRNIRGPRGEQGPQGEVGPQGPRGQMGLRGQIGPKGDKGDKGDTGATPVLDVTASVDENVGNPMVVVESFGPAEHRTFDFQFKNLKGQKGETGATGPQGPQGQQGEPGNYTKPASGIPLSDLNSNVASGIVYDVTANNSGATFASLSALLSSGSLSMLIPTDVRKGGMQIRFVCSSDNKYVQFRYMSSDASTAATFTNTANWQGVDETPIFGSQNLITSGGVSPLNEIQDGTRNIFLLYDFPKYSGISLENGVVSGTARSFSIAFGGYKYYPLYREQLKANTRYTVSCYAKTNGASGTKGQGLQVRFLYSDNSVSVAFAYGNNITSFVYGKATSAENKTLVGIGFSFGSVGDNIWYLKDIQLEEGITATSYIAPYTAVDVVSRENISSLDNRISNIEDSDDVPGYNSTRFVKSGGVEKYLAKTITSTVNNPTYTEGAVTKDGTIVTTATEYGYVAPILLQSGESIVLNQGLALYHGENAAVVYECDSSGNFIKALIVGNTTSYPDMYSNSRNTAMYIGICCYKNQLKYYIYSLEESVSLSKNLDNIYPVADSLTIWSHLFVDKIYNYSSVIVPCQSLFDVRVAAKLGFNLIEINNMKTSDDVWICRHQVNGKFEGLINNTSGEVESVTISNITYAELKNNYRYNSIVPQYQVPVATLEETLAEIRKYNMQPLIYLYDDALTNLVKKYFGNRFVAYTSGTSRPDSLKGITAVVYSQASTVAGVKAAIDGWGAPYMHSIASPSSFTDEELKELVGYAHSKGCSICWAGCYTQEPLNQHYSDLGLDSSASGWNIPTFDYGNIIDIQGNNINGFSDFTLSGGVAVDSDGTIILAAGESISASAASKLLGKCLLDVTFNGNIKVTMGQKIVNSQFTESDVKERVFTSIMENEALAFTITAVSESRIYCLDFKGSQVI